MNRHIYRLVAAVLAAITIVSCNGARKSETYRLLRITDFEDGEFTVRLRCHLKEADEEEIRYCCMEVLGGVRNSTKTRI